MASADVATAKANATLIIIVVIALSMSALCQKQTFARPTAPSRSDEATSFFVTGSDKRVGCRPLMRVVQFVEPFRHRRPICFVVAWKSAGPDSAFVKEFGAQILHF